MSCPDPGSVPSVLHALSQAVLAVSRRMPVEDVLRRLVEAARDLLGAEYAALGVPDEEDSFSRFVVAGVSDEQWRAIGPLPRRHGILGVMLRQARPERLTDIRADPRFRGWPGAHPELVDFLGVPILDGPAVLGAFYLANKRGGGGFTEADAELLTVLAGHAAMALTNAAHAERERELWVVEERTRLARELHDAVAQKLFGLRLTAGAAAARLGTDPTGARAELERVQRLAGDALAELRSAILALRPASLAEDGLVATVGKHVEVLRRVHELRIDLDCAPDMSTATTAAGALAPEAADAAFRIVQEALHNALRHADARAVAVALTATPDGVDVEVRDDGSGFDLRATAGRSRRLGLASMRARALAVGGRFAIATRPGRGTTIRLSLPTEPVASAHPVAVATTRADATKGAGPS